MNTSCVKCNIYLFERWRECYKIYYNDPSFQKNFIGPTITVVYSDCQSFSAILYFLIYEQAVGEIETKAKAHTVLRISDKGYFCPRTENVRGDYSNTIWVQDSEPCIYTLR